MIRDLEAWLLENYGQEVMSPDPGLFRMREALGEKLPSLRAARVITVAGTNGKGETTLRLSALLRNESHLVWTSPHVEGVEERFRSESGLISREELAGLIEDCHGDLRTRGLRLSYYEFLFFVFCTWAIKVKPTFLLLEVGLGGRLDAVNVLDAELLLVPSISRDHQEFLGHRYDGILKEKLALLRPKAQLISFLNPRYLQERARDLAHLVGAEILELTPIFEGEKFHFSERNALLAFAACAFLQNPDKKFSKSDAMEKLQTLEALPNRGEVVEKERRFLLFGSHNVDGMRKLIHLLHSDNYTFPKAPFTSVYVAFSKRDERDLRVLLRMIRRGGLGEVIVTSFPHPKAMESGAMEKLCRQEGMNFVRNIEEELAKGPPGGTSLVTGSYYFLAHVRDCLRRR